MGYVIAETTCKFLSHNYMSDEENTKQVEQQEEQKHVDEILNNRENQLFNRGTITNEQLLKAREDERLRLRREQVDKIIEESRLKGREDLNQGTITNEELLKTIENERLRHEQIDQIMQEAREDIQKKEKEQGADFNYEEQEKLMKLIEEQERNANIIQEQKRENDILLEQEKIMEELNANNNLGNIIQELNQEQKRENDILPEPNLIEEALLGQKIKKNRQQIGESDADFNMRKINKEKKLDKIKNHVKDPKKSYNSGMRHGKPSESNSNPNKRVASTTQNNYQSAQGIQIAERRFAEGCNMLDQDYHGILEPYFSEIESSINGKIQTFTIDGHHLGNATKNDQVEDLFIDCFNQILNIKVKPPFKMSISLESMFSNAAGEPFMISIDIPPFDVYSLIDPFKIFKDMMDNVIEGYYERSDITFECFTMITFKTIRNDEFGGGHFVSIPTKLQSKRCIWNPSNDDDWCLIWCILTHKYKHLFRDKSVYDSQWFELLSEHLHEIDRSPIINDNGELIVNVNSLKSFETKNKIYLNIFKIEETKDDYNVIPMYSSIKDEKVKLSEIINVLLHQNHYMFISNVNSFIKGIDYKKNKNSFMCNRCLKITISETARQTHYALCCNDKTFNYKFDTKNPIIEFRKVGNRVPLPFVIYADFECFIDSEGKHIPSGWGMMTTFTSFSGKKYPQYEKYRHHTGSQCDKTFSQIILAECIKLSMWTKRGNKKLDDKDVVHCNICYMCENVLDETSVNDHCHITGEFRGKVHAACNSSAKYQHYIPVYCHNMKNYDLHLFVKDLFEGEISVIAESSEKYKTLTVWPQIYVSQFEHITTDQWKTMHERRQSHFKRMCKIQFIDSLNFLKGSLDNLSKTVYSTPGNYYNNDPIMQRKGVFPYEYMDSQDKLKDICLPSIEHFASQLTNSNITQSEYEYAKKVWTEKECQTMEDYHDLYLKTDVMTLADIFQTFRDNSIKIYGLDPCRYITTPSLAWDAMLKMTKVKLEKIMNMDLYEFIESGIRGGVSTVGEYNYFKASNNNDMEEMPKQIKYYDVNNLYGKAMTYPLPTGGFEWINKTLEEVFKCTSYGYILQVDLEYPVELHDSHNAFPLAPIHKDKRLMLTLENKMNYIIHVETLKLYVKLGLKILKVHRILQFNQSDFLAKYILFNTLKRSQTNIEHERDFFKLMNNSVFGKTMENKKKQNKSIVVRNETKLRNVMRKFTYKSHKIFSPTFTIINVKRNKVVLDKPMYIGFCVLEFSKLLMYDLYYNVMKRKIPSLTLLYTDTDSLIVVTDGTDREKFGHVINSELGCIKEEAQGITEFVSLKAKCYAFRINETEKMKNKGVKMSAMKAHFGFKDFVDVLKDKLSRAVTFFTIRSKNHELYTLEQKKIALSYDDKKKVRIDDNIEGRIYSHGFMQHYVDVSAVERGRKILESEC